MKLNHYIPGLPQLVSLTLHTNNLTSMVEEVIMDLPRLQSLRLEHNKLSCDCRLAWILDHETLAPLARYSLQFKEERSPIMSCSAA